MSCPATEKRTEWLKQNRTKTAEMDSQSNRNNSWQTNNDNGWM